jgi:7-alpha-hydroxysteroid dehydrogenase
MGELTGRVIAIIGRGTPGDRAVAVALAEDGADIAIATFSPKQQEEFATASIANEVWAIGREQFSHVLDASDTAAAEAFAARVREELGECAALLVIGEGAVATAAFASTFPNARIKHIDLKEPAAMVEAARQAIGPS